MHFKKAEGVENKPTKRQGAWRWSLLVCAVQAACAATAAAATNEFLDMSLEELVDYRITSMSRKEQRVADMAAAAYVISAEEIRRSGAQSIPEALRLVPGLNVAQISRSRWAVSSRGFNDRFSSKLLVQVDGRSIYSPLFSGVLWESQDTVMEDIERIEVIRGPGAALWGTNAMNGVINIVTRMAAVSQGGMVSASAGTGGVASVSMTYGGELDNGGHYKVFGKSKRMGGSPEREGGAPGDDVARQQRLGVRVEPQMAQGKLSIKAEMFQDRSADVWVMPTLPAFSEDRSSYVRKSVMTSHGQGIALQARYSWKGGNGIDHVLQTSIDREKSDHTGLWGTGTGGNKPFGEAPQLTTMGGHKTDLDLDFQQRRVSGQHDIIWGLNLRHTSDHLILPSSPYLLLDGRNQRLSYSAFVHDEIVLSPDRLRLILGSKFEKDGLTGFNMQPNARLLFTPVQDEVYWGALSRSVRSLRRTESQATVDVSSQDAHSLMASIPPNMLTAITQVSPLSNASPKAEVAISLEAGWRKQFSNALSVDAALFVSEYNQLRGARMLHTPVSNAQIQQSLACLAGPVPGACYFTVNGYNSNLDKARSFGGELAVEWHPRAWWKVQASYSHLRVKGVRTGDFLGDSQVSIFEKSAPRHQISLGQDFRLPYNMNLDVRLRYASETSYYTANSDKPTRLSPYTGLDMRLAWKLDRQTELSLQGRNLLQSRHSEFISTLPLTLPYDVQRSALVQAVFRF